MAEQLEWEHYLSTLSSALGMDENEILEQPHLYEDIGIDSLGIFSLGMRLMKTYNINIPLSEVSTIQTVHDLFGVMEKYKENKT
ncbi:MAG: acyl carrier protein [Spirochaetales bacterium]|nr:acyl carrier protein [Spirochaetales bacterium]